MSNPIDKQKVSGASGRSQQKLSELSDLAQALLRCAGTGVYIVQDGKFQYVNPLFQEMTCYSELELLGKYSLDLVYPEDRETVREKAIESLKGGSSLPYEYRFVMKNGEIIWVLEKGNLYRIQRETSHRWKLYGHNRAQAVRAKTR